MQSPREIYRRQRTLATDRIHALPVLVLNVHSRCDCRCVMCDIWKANRLRKELTREDLAAHFDDLRDLGVSRVVLTGGEALMHSNLWQLCALLRELDVEITLLSTGLSLAARASEVVDWCDEVIVSLDGSREVHDRIRGIPRAYDRLVAGVAAVKDSSPDFRVAGRCVVQRDNFHDLPQIIDAAHRIGLDRISFLAVDVSTHAFNRPTLWSRQRAGEVALSRDEVAAFDRTVEQVIVSHRSDFLSGFIAERPAKLRGIVRYFAALNGDGDFPETACNAPWVSAVVEADGTVRPCFFHRPLGNVKRRSLAGILNSANARAFRQQLDVKRDPTCRRCVCTLNLAPHRAP